MRRRGSVVGGWEAVSAGDRGEGGEEHDDRRALNPFAARQGEAYREGGQSSSEVVKEGAGSVEGGSVNSVGRGSDVGVGVDPEIG